MNAGKTTTLLQSSHNYAERGMNPLLLKPLIDDREGQAFIRSRIGLEAEAHIFEKEENFIQQSLFLKKNSASFRAMGSAALDLAFVASGRMDGYWGSNLNLWDMAPGILLITEAGGNITRTDGKKWDIYSKNVLASNSLIHELILGK